MTMQLLISYNIHVRLTTKCLQKKHKNRIEIEVNGCNRSLDNIEERNKEIRSVFRRFEERIEQNEDQEGVLILINC